MTTSTDIVEQAKQNAAKLAVKNHFPSNATHVGIGSGSTVVHVVHAIRALNLPNIHDIKFIPTGTQSRRVITEAGLTVIDLDQISGDVRLDVAFDGADEVDAELNCIKGGGACLYQEKLVAMRAKQFICVADYRKLQPRLLTNWPSVPIEVEPLAVPRVREILRKLGAVGECELRQESSGTQSKGSGSLRTDQNNQILDAKFPPLLLGAESKGTNVQETEKSASPSPSLRDVTIQGEWYVDQLARAIKAIEGVLSVGIFSGVNGYQFESVAADSHSQSKTMTHLLQGPQKPVAAYFGMQDGGVVVRRSDPGGSDRVVEEKAL